MQLTGVPVALLCYIDGNEEVFRHSLEWMPPGAPQPDFLDTKLFCRQVVSQQLPLIITNVRDHPSLSRNGLIARLGIISYIGFPLFVEGKAVGALCATHTAQRDWTLDDVQAMQNIAALATTDLELRNARASLAARDENLYDLLEYATDMIMRVSFDDGSILFANKAVRDILGYSAAELLHMKGIDVVAPEYRDAYAAAGEAVAQRGFTPDFSAELETKRGARVVVRGSANCQYDRGKPASARLIFRDITVKQKLKAELALIEAVCNLVSESEDLELGFTEALERICTYGGWDRGEVWLSKGSKAQEFLASWTQNGVSTEMLPTASHDGESEWKALLEIATRGHKELPHSQAHRSITVPTAFNAGTLVSMPLMSGDECAGVLAFYSTRVIPPSEQRLEVLSAITTQIGPLLRRRLAEDALQESEGRYRHLIETAREGVWILTADGNTEYVNNRLADILGYSEAEILHRPFTDFVHPDSRAVSIEHFDPGGAKIGQSCEYRLLTKNHVDCWALVATSPIFTGNGHLEGVLALVTDITERKIAETQLRIREKQLAEAQQVARMGSWDWDLETGRITASDELYRVLGLPAGPGLTYDLLVRHIAPKDLERVKTAMLDSIARQVPLSIEYTIIDGEGNLRNIFSRGAFYHDETGVSGRMAGIAQDITDRKVAENEFRRTAQLFGAVLAAATNYSVIGCDSNGIIHTFNTGAERLLGYTAEEMIGKRSPVILHLPSEIEERARELGVEPGFEVFVANVRGGASETRDWTYVRKDGTTFQASLTVSAMNDPEGNNTGFIGIGVNITERRAAEKEILAAKEAAEQALKAKSEFLANMSHEIRTPMNGITGMTELLLDTDVTDEQREYLNLVRVSADSLLRIIDDILDFSRIDAGKLRLEPLAFDLRAALHDTLRTLELRAQQKRIRLQYDVHAEVPDRLIGDLGRLRQVIVNLVDNAIKFTEEGQVRLDVSAEDTVGEENGDGDYVTLRVCVADTGIGISPERIDVVLEPFTQADASTTRRYGGSGLGLSISKHLVEMMGGRLWIESEEGEGSRFYFTVKLLREAGDAETPKPSKPLRKERTSQDTPLHILVAEDNPVNQRLVIAILEKEGHTVVLARDGKEAVDLVQSEQFDAVLMDVQMPVLGGFEATRIIRKLEADTGSHLPIIAVTAHAMSGDAERCIESGMDSFCAKPIRSAELLAILERLVPRERRRSATPPGAVSGMDAVLPPPKSGSTKVSRTLKEKKAKLLSAMGDDEELLVELANIFLSDSPAVLDRLKAAIANGDAADAASQSHKLRGSAAIFGADRLTEPALKIEQMGRAGSLVGVNDAFHDLSHAYSEFAELLGKVIALEEESVAVT